MTIDSVYLDLTTLPDDVLILTPNRRLAAWLQRDYDQWMQQQGATTWPKLNAMPLDLWLQQCFDMLSLILASEQADLPRLLTTHQSTQLWKEILLEHWHNPDDVDGLATLAAQARSLVKRWRWDDAQCQSSERFEHQQFCLWHANYVQRLHRHHAIDHAALADWVMEQGVPLLTGLPRKIYCHGFNDPDEPQLKQLQTWLLNGAISVVNSALQPQPATIRSIRFEQLNDQFAYAMQWAIQQHYGTQRIGVVIPNLQPQRARIRALCHHLWSQHPGAADQHWTEVINITAAQRLSTYPLTAHVLLWLRGLNGELSLQEWDVLLTSPYVCPSDDIWLQRDAFIQQLRDDNRSVCFLSALREHWLRCQSSDATAEWLSQLQAHAFRGKQSIVRWIQWFNRFLLLLFPPQGRPLDSEEYQVRQRMLDTVRQLSELNDWLGEIDFNRFREELNSALTEVQFQPQTESAPIQVMGLLEAAGMVFDQLWVCELEAINWPQALNPNPLLPRRIQRALNMPGASPERELTYAKRLLDGFRGAATEVIFSWGAWQGDTEHTCSALIADLKMEEANQSGSDVIQSAEMIQFQTLHAQIEILAEDAQGSPVLEQQAKGGSGLIKAQSLCPFKAYAEYRLGLQSADELAEGIKASDRGSFLHRVLETVWRELQDWTALRQRLEDQSDLEAWLRNIIEREMPAFEQTVYLRPKALYTLEKNRTLAVVMDWLTNIDGKRSPFSVVQVEKRRQLTVGGLQLNLTVDRIDQLADQSYVIIDYKTGDKNHQAWLGERPEEPQLPLYAHLESDKTKGLLFGVLKPGASGYKGLVESESQVSADKNRSIRQADDWNTQITEWKTTVERLAAEFKQGRAEVDPLNPQVCTYCHLASMCRIREVPHDSD